MSLIENPTLYNLSLNKFSVGFAIFNIETNELEKASDYIEAYISVGDKLRVSTF